MFDLTEILGYFRSFSFNFYRNSLGIKTPSSLEIVKRGPYPGKTSMAFLMISNSSYF